MHYLILCYDISENKIRTRLYNYLLKSGSIPLQKSVHILPHNFKNKAEKIGWIQQYIVPKLKVMIKSTSFLLRKTASTECKI